MSVDLPDREELDGLLATLENDTRAWADYAACHPKHGHNPALWFPEGNRAIKRHPDVLAAKQVCNACPVQRECLQHGIVFEPYGVWGGLTELERDVFRVSMGMRSMLWRKSHHSRIAGMKGVANGHSDAGE